MDLDTEDVVVRLVSAPGLPGHEDRVAAVIEELWRPHVDQLRRDALGNLIAVVRGEGVITPDGRRAAILWAAHMDEIGLVVTAIEEDGFLRVDALGGVDPRILLGQEVVVHGRPEPLPGVVGTKPPHLTTAEEARRVPRLSDLFIDVGLTAEEVRRRVRIGDPVSIHRHPARLQGQRLTAAGLDNRAGVAVLTEALVQLGRRRHQVDVYAVATVQEEVGLRGAAVSAYHLSPTLAVAVDTTFGDQPGLREAETCELGKGPALARGANVHPKIWEALQETARAEGIPFQVEPIAASSGTDAWAIQVAGEGIPTGLVSVPLRNMHTPVEVVDLADIRAAGRLLAALAARIHGPWLSDLAGTGWQEVGSGAAGTAQ